MAGPGPIRLPNGQLVGQPGSNGGVHRGPDRQLRINTARAVVLEALTRAGVRLVITETGRRRRHRGKLPMAMVENLVTRLQEIPLSGSDDAVLRLVFGMHAMFQPGPHEKNGTGNGGPRPAIFVVEEPSTSPPEEPAPAKPAEPGTIIGPDGKEYVA